MNPLEQSESFICYFDKGTKPSMVFGPMTANHAAAFLDHWTRLHFDHTDGKWVAIPVLTKFYPTEKDI